MRISTNLCSWCVTAAGNYYFNNAENRSLEYQVDPKIIPVISLCQWTKGFD